MGVRHGMLAPVPLMACVGRACSAALHSWCRPKSMSGLMLMPALSANRSLRSCKTLYAFLQTPPLDVMSCPEAVECVKGETLRRGCQCASNSHSLIDSWGDTPAELLPAASRGRHPRATSALPGAAHATPFDHQQHLSSLRQHLSTTSNISQATSACAAYATASFRVTLPICMPPGSSLGLTSGLMGTYEWFLSEDLQCN